MKSSQLYLNSNSVRLMILLMLTHILGNIVAYTVYIKLASGLGDGYAASDFQGINTDLPNLKATEVAHSIYYYVATILPSPGHGAGFLAPMALGLVVAILSWYTFRDIYKYTNRLLFWTCNLFPHFLIWSGSSSKEQIVMIFGIIVV